MNSQIVDLVRLVASRRPESLVVTDDFGDHLNFADLLSGFGGSGGAVSPLSDAALGEVVPLGGTVGDVLALLNALDRADRVIVTGSQCPEDLGRAASEAAATVSGRSRRNWYSSQTVAVPVKELLMHTSGTAGRARLIVHDEETFLRCLWRTVVYQEQMLARPVEADPDDIFGAWAALSEQPPLMPFRFFCTLPMASVGGLGMLLRSLLSGMTIHFSSVETMLSQERMFGQFAPTHLALTPYSAQRVLRRVRTTPRLLRSVLHIGIGSARVDSRLALDLAQLTRSAVGIGYGSTELGGAALLSALSDPTDLRPLSGVTVVAPTVGVSGPAELLLRPGAAAKGFIQPDGTTGPLLNPDGVFRTGDIAEMTDVGGYRVLGRADSKILRGGRLIDPVECEMVLRRIPDVLEAVVAGRDAGTEGDQELCAVLLVDGESPLAASGRVAFVRACRDHGVPGHLIPSRVFSVPDTDHRLSDEKMLRSILLERCTSRRDDRTEGAS